MFNSHHATTSNDGTLGRLLFIPLNSVKVPYRGNPYVRSIRFILPILAGLVLAVVVLWIHPQENPTPPHSGADSVPHLLTSHQGQQSPSPQNSLINPRFEGSDDNGRSYTITAKKAVQDLGESAPIGRDTTAPIFLSEPTAYGILSRDNQPLYAHATIGHYDPAVRTLILDAGVEVRLGEENKSYTLSTPTLTIDFLARRALSSTPVEGHGADGVALQASGLVLATDTGHLTLTGPARFASAPQNFTLTAKKSLEWLRDTRRVIAYQDATATQENNTLTAATIEARYDSSHVLTDLYAYGAARLVMPPEGTLHAAHSFVYNVQTGRFVAHGDVFMKRGPQDWVRAQEMTAFLRRNAQGDLALHHIEAAGDVVITHEGSTVRGSRASIDVASGTAHIIGGETENTRVRAIMDIPVQEGEKFP